MKKKRAVDSIAVGRNSTAGTHRHRNVMKCRIAAFLLQGQESRIINNVTTRIHDNMSAYELAKQMSKYLVKLKRNK